MVVGDSRLSPQHRQDLRWKEVRLHFLGPLAGRLRLTRIELDPVQDSVRLVRGVLGPRVGRKAREWFLVAKDVVPLGEVGPAKEGVSGQTVEVRLVDVGDDAENVRGLAE